MTATGKFRYNNSVIDDLSDIADSNAVPSPVHMPNFAIKTSDEYNEDGSPLDLVNNRIPGSPHVARPRINTDPSFCRRRLNTDSSFYSRPKYEQRKKIESIINDHRYATMRDTTPMSKNAGTWENGFENFVASFRRYFLASMDFKTSRGCCRPVTMSLNQRQQFIRKAIATTLLAIMFVTYSIPITLTAHLTTIEKLSDIWPDLKVFVEK